MKNFRALHCPGNRLTRSPYPMGSLGSLADHTLVRAGILGRQVAGEPMVMAASVSAERSRRPMNPNNLMAACLHCFHSGRQ